MIGDEIELFTLRFSTKVIGEFMKNFLFFLIFKYIFFRNNLEKQKKYDSSWN